MKKIFFFFFLCIPIFVFAKEPKTKLIVFLSVDQMRADYLQRFEKYFSGGLKMLNSGIVYANADLNYATSETGPGHATLGTGCYPWKSGITSNEWTDIISMNEMYCVADSTAGKVDGAGGGFSPKNLVVPAIGDWLKKESPQSKVFSVSSKDRAAILMAGKNPDGAYWYSKQIGGMVTSDYYVKSLPQWVKDFNSENWVEKIVPDAWTKSLPEAEYEKIGPDDFYAEQKWGESSAFPHIFRKGKKAEQMPGTPYGDKFLLTFAARAMKSENLGKRGVTDILCVSLSNCDYVGHGYGPDSHEIMDLIVKMDGYLAEFFKEIEKQVGKDGYIIALSADHAVCPLPEYNAQYRNLPAKRYLYNEEVKPKVDSLSFVIQTELHSTEKVIVKNNFLNYGAATHYGWDRLRLEQRVREGMIATGIFSELYFRNELISNDESLKPYINKFRHSYYPPRGEDFQYLIREHCLISSKTYGTSHGTPYKYDTNIPLVIWWNGAKAQKIEREVHSADIAPTLAKFSGFSFPETIDGRPLQEVVR